MSRLRERPSMDKKFNFCYRGSKVDWNIFWETWKILTKKSEILKLEEGYKIPFHANPVQEKITEVSYMNLGQRQKVQVEINNMLKKRTICKRVC